MTTIKDDEGYKLKLTGAGLSVDRSITQEVAQRIITLVMGGSGAEPLARSGIHPGHSGTADASSPKAFMAGKRPTTDMEKITCLAYFLTHHRSTTSFKTKELTDLNIEAAQPKLSNPSATARNSVTHGLLSLAGGARKQITTRGETVVDALPDREKVKEALAQHPVRRARRKAVSRKKK